MKYFTFAEFERSRVAGERGIDNRIPDDVKPAIEALVNNILDPLREAWGRPIRVTSGYRSPALNRAVGGVATSQHVTGHAADITVGTRKENMALFRLIQGLKLPFDQLIFEKGDLDTGPDWVHVSYDANRNRRKIRYL